MIEKFKPAAPEKKGIQQIGKLIYALCLGLILISGPGCSVYRTYTLPLEDEIKAIEGDTRMPDSQDPWWESFGDDQLNRHIATALDRNFSLTAAWERLTAAKAVARKTASSLYPSLNASGGLDREIDRGEKTDQLTFGAAASYEVDLWGRIRSQTDAEALRVQASEEAFRTAALSLSADIAVTWMRLIEAYSQHALLERQLRTNDNTLEILKARFATGLVRSEDILRQQLLNREIEEEKIIVETEMKTLEHQISLLRGELPLNKTYRVSRALPVLTPVPSLSSGSVTRRPDIRKAYFDIRAADKDLAAAVRDQYPQLTLSASYISEAATPGNLFSNWITALAGAVVSPLFDGGRRQAEVSRREALRSELIALYGETVLQAFREVEDALINEKNQGRRIKNLEERLDLAGNSYDQVRLGYFSGANDFLSVLVARYQLQSVERDLLLARRNLVEYRISLYRALAGGFKTPDKTKKQKDN